MPSPDVYWLALRRVHGVGPRTCKLLIEKFGTPEKIFQLNSEEIAAAGVPRNTAHSITEFRDFEALEKMLQHLLRRRKLVRELLISAWKSSMQPFPNWK